MCSNVADSSEWREKEGAFVLWPSRIPEWLSRTYQDLPDNAGPVCSSFFQVSEEGHDLLDGLVGRLLTLNQASLFEVRIWHLFYFHLQLLSSDQDEGWHKRILSLLRDLVVTEYLRQKPSSKEFDRLYEVTADRAEGYERRIQSGSNPAAWLHQNLLNAESGAVIESAERPLVIGSAEKKFHVVAALETALAFFLHSIEPICTDCGDLRRATSDQLARAWAKGRRRREAGSDRAT